MACRRCALLPTPGINRPESPQYGSKVKVSHMKVSGTLAAWISGRYHGR